MLHIFVAMKADERILILLFSLLCLCACKDKSYPRILLVADSLTNVNPDSAIAILEEQKDNMERASEETQMYYRLLCIKADDKAYITHTSNSRILPVLHYYIEREDDRHLPEAYYYAGRVYRDLGDAPQALEYFRKASELPDVNADLRSKIYSQLRTLFYYQCMYDEALTLSKESYQFDSLRNDRRGMVFDLRDMASAYRAIEKLDSALIYYQKACDLAYTLQDSSLMRMTQSQIASICIQLKKYDRAKKALEKSYDTSNKLALSSFYSIASNLYRQTGDIDSAVYYYNKLIHDGNIYGKRYAYWNLAEISLEKENASTKAYAYLKQYIQYEDSIINLTNAESIRKMNSMYNYQLREQENIRLKAENDKKAQANTYFIIFIGVFFIAVFAYWQYNKRKRWMLIVRLERSERLQEEQYRKSALYIEEMNKKIALLEQKAQESECENRTLKELLLKERELARYAQKQAQIELDIQNAKHADLVQSEIYTYIQQQISSENYKINRAKWDILKNTIDEIYDGFTTKLDSIYKLSFREQQVCLLIKANIQPADIAKLTNQTKQSVSQIRGRLYEKFFNKKGEPKLWDEFIASL